MAQSPEHGQPKAPDKSSSALNQNAIEINQASATLLADPITNCGNNMTSTTNNTSVGNSSGSNSCSGAPPVKSNQNFKQMNDDEFLGLLVEAYSYKTPRDRENKSEAFRILLDDVERTKDHQFPAINETRYQRGTNNQHGGSLQDLKETNDILDNDYTYGKNNRRHHHNWRTPKYTSSVSTRQREGGSLPSNVNVSTNCYSLNEPRFLTEVGTKRRGKTERTFSGTSSNSGHESIISYESKDDSVLGDHSAITSIDIFEDASSHMPQGKHKPVDIDVGVEVYATMNLKTTVEISCSEKSEGHWVDNTVSFPSLERSKANNDATTCALPFDDSSKSCQSVLGEKPDKPKTAIYQSSKVIPQQLDENSNAIVTKKKKKFDADRNTTTVDLTEVEGYRGNDPIETLVKFIENNDAGDTTKKPDRFTSMTSGGGGGSSSGSGGGKKKDKKKDKDLKKDMHKVKKSSSLEELRSCTKLDEDEKLAAGGVIMRTKAKKTSSTTVATSPTEGKENIKQNTKRGERRSWGTEELTYLGENNAIEEVREKNKEREKSKRARELVDKQTEKVEKVERTEKLPPQKKKKSERSLSVLSMESAQSETAEFHVVTKKKRSKKRQSLEETRSTTGKVGPPFSLKSGSGPSKKYQTSTSFANDRDAYLSSYNHESRRKSTSSVPPSEKSDSSDLDSVHSLPIESVSGRHQSGSNSQMQSYADIARTVNPTKNLLAWQTATNGNNNGGGGGGDGGSTNNQKDNYKWPAVSASNVSNATNLDTVEANLSAAQAIVLPKNRSTSTKSKSLTKDFPDLATDRNNIRMSNNYDGASSCSSTSSTSTVVKQVPYSEDKITPETATSVKGANKQSVITTVVPPSKLTDVIRSGGETIKQTLQKSKSADNERLFYSVEQYPALEKTVKRHSTQNSISDIKSLQTPASATGFAFSAGNQVISNKQRSPPMSSIYNQQQQLTQSTPISQQFASSNDNNPNAIADVCLLASTNSDAAALSSSNDTVVSVVAATAVGASSYVSASTILSSATSALSDTSKIVINNNLDMNTNLAATSSSCSNNLENMNTSTNSIIVANNGKKIKVNTKASYESTTPNLLETINVKSVATKPSSQGQKALTTTPAVTTDGAVPIANNPKKLAAKYDSQPPQQQLRNTGGISTTINRKPKKDKQQHFLNSTNSDDLHLNSNYQCSSNSHSGKHSNRPAVIILNDTNDCASYGDSDFTFGDFNEEELRLFETNHHHLDDSGSYNISVPDMHNSSSMVSDTIHEDIHLSPHSDQGYSSSNNRSIFSEPIDQNNLTLPAGNMPQKMTTGVVYMAFDSESAHLVPANTTDDCRIVALNASPFPNDSAIIMATTSSSISSQYNSSNHLPPQSNIVAFPASSLSSSSSLLSTSLSNTTKVLSNNNANSANNTKRLRDTKQNESTKYDLGVTNNDLIKNVNTNSDNVNISNIMDNTSNVNNSTISSCSNTNNSNIDMSSHTRTRILSSSPSSSSSVSSTTSSSFTLLPSSLASTSNNLSGTNAKILLENCTNNNNNNYTATTAAGTAATTIQQKSSCDTLKRIANNNNNNKKEINIRFVAPPITHDINTANYEKLVDFVGLAWEDILHGVNGSTEYYDGQ